MTFRLGHALRGTLVACLVAAGTTLATSPAAAAVEGVGLSVSPASSGVLAPNTDLQLSLTVTNSTGQALPGGEVDVVLDRGEIGSREELSRWLAVDSEEEADGATIATVPLATEQLQPGTNRIDITVPAAAVGLSGEPDDWGVHELAIEAEAGGEDLGVARSTIVWNPGQPYQATQVAVVSPIVVPANSSGLIGAEALETYTSPSGLLTRQLDAVDGEQVAVAIDPMIIASIRALGVSAPESALAWLDRLDDLGNETFPLAYGDADLTAANQAGVPLLPTVSSLQFALDPADFPADAADAAEPEASATPSPSATPAPEPQESTLPTLEELLAWDWTRTDVAWPVEDTVLPTDLDYLRDNGYTTTILSSGNVDVPREEDLTPGAAVTANGTGVAMADGGVSSLLRQASTAASDAEWGRTMAELAATLAVTTDEQPDSARALLATTTRIEPTSALRFGQTLSALGALPWVDTTNFSSAMSATPVEGGIRTDRTQSPERLTAVAELARDVQAVDAYSVIAEDPAALTGRTRARYAALLSPAWFGNTTGWESARAEFRQDAAAILGGVRIPESSTVNFYSYGAPLPISVSNDLPQAVTVTVSVASSSAILQVEQPISQLTIEPNSSARLQVPVTSVASGNATVTVRITGPSGQEIAPPSIVAINVQAEWESLGTAIFAALVVLIFTAGIVRTVLKRRRTRAAVSRGTPDAAKPDTEEAERPEASVAPDQNDKEADRG